MGKGASWFPNHIKNEPWGSVEPDRAVPSSVGTVGWDGAPPSQSYPSFTGSPFIGTSWSGLGARNLGPDFSSAITKWTSPGLSCLLVKIGKGYPGLLPGKEHAKKQTVLRGAAVAAGAGDYRPLGTVLVWHRPSCSSLATEGQCLGFLYFSSTHRVSGYTLCTCY